MTGPVVLGSAASRPSSGVDYDPTQAIAHLRARNPHAADLAALCALALRVEPQLLRLLRLLLPGADVSAETDLWRSDLVAGASVGGLSLRPAVAHQLCAQLRLPRWDGLRAAAGELIDAAHVDVSWSARLEEQLARTRVEAEPSRRTRELVLAAIKALSDAGERAGAAGSVAGASREQVGVARWLLAALARLPVDVANTDAASAAQLAAHLHLANSPPQTSGTAAQELTQQRWLPYLLGSAVDTVDVPVGFAPGRLELYPAGPGTAPVAVPRTDPLVLDVEWGDGGERHTARLTFTERQRLALAVPSDQVELRTLTGHRVRLSDPRAAGARGAAGFGFGTERAHYRPCLGREQLVAQLSQELGGDFSWLILTGPAGVGKTVLACALAERAEAGGGIVVQHFFGVEPSWDDPELVVSSLIAQLRAAVPGAEWNALDNLLANSPAGNGSAAGRLAQAWECAGQAVRGPILALIDNIPGADGDAAANRLLDLLPRGSRAAGAVIATYRSDGDSDFPDLPEYALPVRIQRVDVATRQVCDAMIAAAEQLLARTFAAVDGPFLDGLVSLAGGNPGRVAAILDWVREQQATQLRLADIPSTLTVQIADSWAELAAEGAEADVADWLSYVAVAGPGFTCGDLARLVPTSRHDALGELLSSAVRLGLVRTDVPVRFDAAAMTAQAGLADAMQERFGRGVLEDAHLQHAIRGGFAPDLPVGELSGYQVASAVRHAVAATTPVPAGSARAAVAETGRGRDEVLPGWRAQALARDRRRWPSGGFLHRRASEGGVAAALADLEATARWPEVAPVLEAARFVASALAPVPPQRFVDLVANEMRRAGCGEAVVGQFLLDARPTPLAVRSLRSPESTEPLISRAYPVLVAGVDVLASATEVVHRYGGSTRATAGHVSQPVAVAAGNGVLAVAGVPAAGVPAADPADAAPTRLAVLATPPPTSPLNPVLVLEFSHEAAVNAVAFSPDGSRLVTGSVGSASRIFDTAGKPVARLEVSAKIAEVAFEPDGTRVVAVDEAGADVARLDATRGRRTAWSMPKARVVERAVRRVAVSPDGARVAVGHDDGTVRIVDVPQARVIANVAVDGGVGALAISADGATAVVGAGSVASLIDVDRGKPSREFRCPQPIQVLALSPDGQQLAIADSRATVLVDVATATRRGEISHDGVLQALAFSPDGSRLATAGTDLAACVYDVATGDQLARVAHPDVVLDVTFAPDGGRLATACQDALVRVFDLAPPATGPVGLDFDRDLPSPICWLGAVHGAVVAGTEAGIVIAYLASGDPAWTLVGHGASITGVISAPGGSGSRLVTASADCTVRIWEVESQQTLAVLRHRSPVRHVVAVGVRHLVTADDGGQVHWWDAVSFAELGPPFGHHAEVTALVALPTPAGAASYVLSCAADGTIVCSREELGAIVVEPWAEGGPAIRLGAGHDNQLVTCDDDGRVRWWQQGQPRGEWRAADTLGRPLALYPDGPSVTLAHTGGLVNVAARTSTGDAGEPDYLRCLAVDPRGVVAVGAREGIWRADSAAHGDWTRLTSAVAGPPPSESAATASATVPATQTPAMAPRSVAAVGAFLLVAWANGDVEFLDPDGNGGRFVSAVGLGVAGGRDVGAIRMPDDLLSGLRSDDELAGVLLPMTGWIEPDDRPGALAVLADDRTLAIGTSHGRLVRLVDDPRTALSVTAGPAPVTALAEIGDWIVAGMADGALVRWQPGGELVPIGRHEDRVEGLAAVGGRLVSASADRSVRLWDVEHSTELGQVRHTAAFRAVAAHPEPGRVIARSDDAGVWVIDVDGLGAEPATPGLFGPPHAPQAR